MERCRERLDRIHGTIHAMRSAIDVDLVETAEGLVAVPKQPTPVLTAEVVSRTLDRIRR